MMFDDIQEITSPTYSVKDFRETIETVKEMQGGFRAARVLARTRSEIIMVDKLLDLADSLELVLKSFPPAGTYQRIGD